MGCSIDPPGYDAGKKIKGKKRHILVDAADIRDRDGGSMLMATLFGLYPFLLKLYADGGYQGPEFRQAMDRIMRQVNVEIVKRSDQAKGFVVLPKRWVVKRTLAWLGRCQRIGNVSTEERAASCCWPLSASWSDGWLGHK